MRSPPIQWPTWPGQSAAAERNRGRKRQDRAEHQPQRCADRQTRMLAKGPRQPDCQPNRESTCDDRHRAEAMML